MKYPHRGIVSQSQDSKTNKKPLKDISHLSLHWDQGQVIRNPTHFPNEFLKACRIILVLKR